MKLRLFVLPLLLSVAASAQTLPPGVEKRSSVAGITEYGFPNGLRVLLFPDASSPRITVNMTYLVGSRHEGYGESGMAHLLEHLNFIRTTDNRNIKEELVSHGATWNGTTSYDRTNYFETFSASDDNLRWALGLEAARMTNVRMEKAILDTEMTVVRNEFERGENSPQRVLMERVMSTAYLWHNYGKSTIGSRVDLEKVPIDRLAAFYRKYYQPDNAVLILAGQFDAAKALATAAQTVGSIPRPARTLDATYTVEPTQDGERTVELRRTGTGKTIMMAYHGPSFAHPDAAAIEVLEQIMSGGNGTGRLYKALVDNKKALSANMGIEELHDPGMVTFTATLNEQQSLEEVRKTILETIRGVTTEPPTKEEVDRAKTRIVQEMEKAVASSQRMVMDLSEAAASGDWRLWFTNFEQLKRVTQEDVVRVAKLYFRDSNRTVGTFIPEAAAERTDVPATPDLEKVIAEYKPNIKVQEAGEFDPAPASIEKRVTRTKLGNGFQLALLPKQSRGGLVNASVELRFGDERSLAGKSAISTMAASLLMRGTKNKTRQQIQEEMDRLNARVSVGGGRGAATGVGSVSANVQTTAENLLPALQLAVEILREPAFPENDFEQIRKQQIEGVRRGMTDPGALAQELLQKTLNPYPRTDVRHFHTMDERLEDLDKVTLDDVKKFHAQFYGASNGTMVVVGQFDSDALRKAATGLFGEWKSPANYARIVAAYQKVSPINQKIETPDKQNAQFEAGMRLRMTDKDPDFPAMVLANYMFGGEITSRLPDRVRNREGLSYSVNSIFSAPSEGDGAGFTAVAIANPGNTPKVEASFRDELARTLKDGFAAAELEAAKKAYLDLRRGGRAQDQSLVSLLMLREEYGRTLDWDVQMDQKLAALTLDQVNAAFRKHLDPAAITVVKAGDFKTAGVYQ